jgi:predicted Zn-ribbon and HTH transcriptional regulator
MNKYRKNFVVLPEKNYICRQCGHEVTGGRYNNHCPNCLWSLHVDSDVPGDRASNCRGLMEPVGVEQRGGVWRIKHKCRECKIERIVDAKDDDNPDVIEKLMLMGSMV